MKHFNGPKRQSKLVRGPESPTVHDLLKCYSVFKRDFAQIRFLSRYWREYVIGVNT